MNKETNKQENKGLQVLAGGLSAEDQMKAFLGTSPDIQTTVHLKRFEGVDFVLKPIDGNKMDSIRERATYYKKTKKSAEPQKVVDEELIQAGIIQSAVIAPDMEPLKEAYKKDDLMQAIKAHFLAGELQALTQEVLDLSGFNEDLYEEDVKKHLEEKTE